MRFLSGVADDGEGSAALPSRRRPDRLLSRRAFNLVLVSGVAAVIGLVAARIVFSGQTPASQTINPVTVTDVQPSPLATPGLLAVDPSTSEVERHFEYAIGLHDLRGLPVDTSPGTPLELWVAWDDAYAKGPQVQRLAKGLTVVRFVEPVTPEGPMVVVLSVPERAMRAVMYGDLYGSFSVAKPIG